MTRIVLWFMSTLTVVVLLVGYSTSTAGPGAVGGQASIISSGGTATADSGETSTAAGTTVTGAVAQTRWGPVQVEITVADGTITGVSVVEYPTENRRDREINETALPVLVDETLDAQGADVDMVSGATVTSEGYLESLQSALDQAGL